MGVKTIIFSPMDHSRKMLRFQDMLLFLNPPTQHEALLRARSAALAIRLFEGLKAKVVQLIMGRHDVKSDARHSIGLSLY